MTCEVCGSIRLLRVVVAWGLVLSASALGREGPVLAMVDTQAEPGNPHDQITRLEGLIGAQQVRIRSLRQRIESAEDRPPGAARTSEVRRVVRELMADAGFRETLYPDTQQTGYDKGFYIASADEAFRLRINGTVQFRWTGQNRQTDNPRLSGRQRQDDINGFEMQDVRLIFRGYLHSPKLLYGIVVKGVTDSAHEWRTHYAHITYEHADELQLTAGLVKLPFGRQELTSKTAQQFVDRSLANEMFNLDRGISAMVHGTLAKRLTYVAAVANGFADPTDSPSREQLDTHLAYLGRLMVHILGRPIRAESDLAYSKSPQLETGLSVAYHDDDGDRNGGASYSVPDRIRMGRGIGGNAASDLTGTDLLQFGADAAFRYRGLSATAEYWVRSIDGDSALSDWERLTGRSDATHQQGGTAQAGYFIIPKKIELAARLSGVWDNDGDDVWEYAFGVNYFPWRSYNAVLQADFTRIAEAPSTSSSANWSRNDEINMVRVQLRLKF